MDQIVKFLRKLNKKERQVFLLLMEQIKKDYRSVPQLKSLIGKKNWFRVRVGRYRIIFEVKKGNVDIRKISKRDDQTYSDF
jgi:mRNA-degrading endonuclease RelE of RelBE toxin-antitoxin system